MANINREIGNINRELRQLNARINKLKKWLAEEAQNAEPNLQNVFSAILDKIILYETAKKYLDDHLNGHSLPLGSWKAERAKLTAEKDALYREYYRLKNEVRDVEIIKRNIEQIVRRDEPGMKIKRMREAEL